MSASDESAEWRRGEKAICGQEEVEALMNADVEVI
jgi:hypothetical protein